MTQTVTGAVTETMRRLVGDSDLRMIGVTIGGVYLIATLLAIAAGYDVGGIVNTLRAITVFAAGYGMLVLALNLHWGYTGLFNIGVAGFMAIGTYVTAILSAPPDLSPGAGLGLPIPIAVLGGMLAAAIAGVLTALPALKMRADYLAIVTVALSEIIRLSIKSQTLAEVSVAGVTVGTGGGRGISYPAPSDAASWLIELVPGGTVLYPAGAAVGIARPVVTGLVYMLILVAFTAAFYWLLVQIGQSPFGRVLKAIREDELVASALGKDTRIFKLKVFAVGCALMGLGGYLWLGRSGFVNDLSFRPDITFFVFVALIIGGAGSNTGSVLGGIIFSGVLFYLPQFISQNFVRAARAPDTFVEALSGDLAGYLVANISALRFVAIGVLLVWLMQRRPEGILGHRMEAAAAIDLRGGRAGGSDDD